MAFKIHERLIAAAAALLAFLPSSAQEQTGQRDSLVRLMKASSLELIEKSGITYRKVVDATFLHNDTYLICDTALWNVDLKTIEAQGNVKLMQENTVLTSDKADYLIDEDLAKFRGPLVQLEDKDKNTLRTRVLDYNTRDSVAYFHNGASMKDKEGQIIEGKEGVYDSKLKKVTFRDDVNMFTDSVFVKTSLLDYSTNDNSATFPNPIDFWKDGNMLSANAGWYDRKNEIFFFRDNVHAQSEAQEAWSDTLFFYRNLNDLEMHGSAQVQDTTRNVYSLSDYLYYKDSTSTVTLKDNAAVAIRTEDKKKETVDTLYMGAASMVYRTMKKCDVPESSLKDAKTRLGDMASDAVAEYRRRAAEEAAKAAEEAAKEREENSRGSSPKRDGPGKGVGESSVGKNAPAAPADTVAAPVDSLVTPVDTVAVPVDSLAAVAEQPDTSKIGFLLASGDVKMFRKDMQMRCDSLMYNDLDSIARFYKSPVIWNEGNRQYSSDSLYTLIRGGHLDKANLMSNAFIITQEDSICFDQIKGSEVVAYFDQDSNLSRFDALGDANALFYLKENDVFATVNKVECKMLSGLFKDGDLDRVYYFDEPKNDAYPVVQLPEKEKEMKGFNWKPEDRPSGPDDITPLKLRASERSAYAARPRTTFTQTDLYFPGYMESVYKGIALRDSLDMVHENERQMAADSVAVAADSLAITGDGDVAVERSVPEAAAEQGPVSDSGSAAKPEAVKAAADTVGQAAEAGPTRKEMRETAKALRWAKLDARDADKAKAKAEKALAKKREKTRQAVIAQRKQEEKDKKKLERYIARFEKKALKQKDKNKSKDEEPIEETADEQQQ